MFSEVYLLGFTEPQGMTVTLLDLGNRIADKINQVPDLLEGKSVEDESEPSRQLNEVREASNKKLSYKSLSWYLQVVSTQ